MDGEESGNEIENTSPVNIACKVWQRHWWPIWNRIAIAIKQTFQKASAGMNFLLGIGSQGPFYSFLDVQLKTGGIFVSCNVLQKINSGAKNGKRGTCRFHSWFSKINCKSGKAEWINQMLKKVLGNTLKSGLIAFLLRSWKMWLQSKERFKINCGATPLSVFATAFII